MQIGDRKMKGILEFNLPEDREEFEEAQNGWKYKGCLTQLSEYLRKKYKHVDPINESYSNELESVRIRFLEILRENEVNLG